VTDWTALLDAMEDGLEAFPPVLVEVPRDLEPMPSALAPRARMLLERMTAVSSMLELKRAEVGRQLGAMAAVRAVKARVAMAYAPVPHFLDTKA
jgi:hypothetical protein